MPREEITTEPAPRRRDELTRSEFLANTQSTTTEPVQPGDFTGVMPEFGRCQDVRRIFGLKRGTCYNLLADRKIKGVLLRVRGKKSGCRLWDMASVRRFIHSQMEATV